VTGLWQSEAIDDRTPLAARLAPALEACDQANQLDPRRQRFEGRDHPRELIFARRVHDWLLRLEPAASEAVRLAARGHTLRRWEIPRDRYPSDTAGYHAWRAATAAHSAGAVEALLRPLNCPDELLRRVGRLIRKELPHGDTDAQLLEDADCLAFLELKLADYLDRWDDEQLARILRGTWTKMSQRARALARRIPLDPRIGPLLERL